MKVDDPSIQKQEFYQYIGRLFYAVAASDKVIRSEEIAVMKEIIAKRWRKSAPLKDRFGTDVAWQIEIVFDWLDANKPEAEASFEKFAAYYQSHTSLFTSPVKEDLLYTCNEIASAFREKNKLELIMLARLQNLFKD